MLLFDKYLHVRLHSFGIYESLSEIPFFPQSAFSLVISMHKPLFNTSNLTHISCSCKRLQPDILPVRPTKSHSTLHSIELISRYSALFSIAIVLSVCDENTRWLSKIECFNGFDMFVYIKCDSARAHVDRFLPHCVKVIILTSFYYVQGTVVLSIDTCFFFQAIQLTSKKYQNHTKTILFHIYNNYHVLSNYTLFLKSNFRNRRQPFNLLQRCAGVMQQVVSSTLFLNAAEYPKIYKTSKYTSFPKTYKFSSKERSMQSLSCRNTRTLGLSRVPPRDIPILVPNLSSLDLKQTLCGSYCVLKCADIVWIPVRSQFLVHKSLIHLHPRELCAEHHMFNEYMWGLFFNCYVIHKKGMRKENVIYLHCI